MHLIYCCPNSAHVSVGTVHPSLLWSSLLLHPGGTFSCVCLPTYSLYRPFTTPNQLNLTFCHLSVMSSTFSLSLALSFLTFSLTVWPQAHLHIKGKGMFLYSAVSSPLDRSKRFTLFTFPDRPVHSDTNSASPGSILAMQQLCAMTKSFTFPPLSIARYSFIQLSQQGRQ